MIKLPILFVASLLFFAFCGIAALLVVVLMLISVFRSEQEDRRRLQAVQQAKAEAQIRLDLERERFKEDVMRQIDLLFTEERQS